MKEFARNVSIRRLKTLNAIAETESLAAAAELVLVSPVAVSQQMKTLERELGIELFDRRKRSPEINPLGHALVQKAREIVHAYDALIRDLTGDGSIAGEITIGALPTTMAGLVPRSLGALQAAYPSLHIRIVPGMSADLYPQVDRGFLDAAIVSEPAQVHDHLDWLPFAEEPLVVLAPEDAVEDDPIALLENHPYIRFSRRAWVGQLIDEWLRARKLVIRETMELDTLESIANMVCNRLGVSIVPEPCVSPTPPLPLKRLSLGPSAKPRVLGLLIRKDFTKSRLVDIFLDELRRLVASNCEST